MSDIATAVSVTKDDLRTIVKKRGSTNRSDFGVGDQVFPPGGLVLVGFVGALNMETKKYEGEYRFRLPQPKDDESEAHDFSKLPGLAKEEPAKKREVIDVGDAHIASELG